MQKSIKASNITFKYDEATIINNITFQIEKNSFITIIGPNGSGKSTLLKLLASNLKPQGGTIVLNDISLTQYSTKGLAMEMAVVPQDTAISYDFNVMDIVLMGRNPHIKRFSKETHHDLEKVKDAMVATNTWHLRDRSINEISGGERQRAIIAKAIAQESKVILLDEPTSSLDIHHQLEVLELLKSINKKQGVTIIAVLHDINLAARYSEEIILLHKGCLVTMGKTEEVLTVEALKKAYAMEMIIDRNPYTGSIQINPISLIKKSNQPQNKRIHLVCGGGTGKGLIQSLVEGGYVVTIGVVNRGDGDWEMASIYKLQMAEELPFSEIGEGTIEKAHRLADAADIIIMTDLPIGWGNLKNLDILYKQLKKGKKVYAFNNKNKFDYTGGKALKKLQLLKESGLIFIEDKEHMLHVLEASV
ncbi:ABC transporter ATP-binding protein [Alkaliphilus pronyensis]|nr:ABC transporter ATP-binding protein [Alkaliphilus pronyensis]